jgi:serine/threonine-protein kinase
LEPAAGTIIAEKYRLESPLARGGMGAVWVARHMALGSQVAVKFVDKNITKDPIFLVRFEREARASAAIQSPHVVHVHDFGVQDGTPYLVMELLHGEDLRARIKRVKRLNIPDTARIVVQIGKALRRAHALGIVHRDLKPANVYLAQNEDEEIVKILDFGIAKETDGPEVGESTKTGEVFGSPTT